MNRLYSRPFDPTGNAVMNLIVGEVRPLAEADDRIFIPSHGPFYTDTLVVRSKGYVLKRNKDYEIKALHFDATNETGKEIGCVVKITNRDFFEVTIDYQVVGGLFSEVASVLRYLIQNSGNVTIDKIPWDAIFDKPDFFNPASHMHPYWEFSGWEPLAKVLNQILNGVYWRKQAKTRGVYDYFNTKKKAFEEWRDWEILQAINKVNGLVNLYREPLNVIRLYTNNNPPAVASEGQWLNLNDRDDTLLGFTANNTDIGKLIRLSETIVYPIPDNIIWDENDNPILQDGNEWIYRDNEHPVYPLAVEGSDDDGVEFTAEQFNIMHVRGYRKVAHPDEVTATLSASPVNIKDGETTTFTLTTQLYPAGLEVNYRLDGVGAVNVDKPLTGVLTIGEDGIAKLSVKLLAGSPPTYENQMVLTVNIGGTLTAAVNYTLSSNNTKRIESKFTKGFNDIAKELATAHDQFALMVERVGWLSTDSQDVQLLFSFDDGAKHPIKIDFNKTATPGTAFTTKLDRAKDWFNISIEPGAVEVKSKLLSVNISYLGKVLSTAKVPVADITAIVYVMSMISEDVVTTVKDDELFRFVVETNTSGAVLPIITENTVGKELTPDIGQSLPILTGTASTPIMMVSRARRDRKDYVTMQFKTLGGRILGSERLTILPED